MNLDPAQYLAQNQAPDPAIFSIVLQDANKNHFFLPITF
jgi:hypothetical protein